MSDVTKALYVHRHPGTHRLVDRDNAAYTLADAYAELFDETPVDAEWLKSMGWKQVAKNKLFTALVLQTEETHLKFEEFTEAKVTYLTVNAACNSIHNVTRGSVLRLLSALSIAPKGA